MDKGSYWEAINGYASHRSQMAHLGGLVPDALPSGTSTAFSRSARRPLSYAEVRQTSRHLFDY
ncbi:hypothetical protein OG883_33125 [Streptomyces sp. NBC_01142]|uniref:hypothetical protein n=1 Tax=Streptomyces sp. NBC_01142 TaxID=2975865 RepID=UPI0022594C29|nr:hypothetical protein [Streptomyces sp. NBC_01142]MCX4824615.1 hypothetical protein [Streptomyces sp. NBC_01142]